jgi:hypothetical protein
MPAPLLGWSFEERGMMHIFQIYYSEQTRKELDPGFAALDNLSNKRPDWREYWPIRNYLLRNRLADGSFYGFLSPKFRQKTSLAADQVKDFILSADQDTDVVIFSPYVDQSAFFPNIFLQGDTNHDGLLEIANELVRQLGWNMDFGALVMDSTNTIFCNYFVAKPRFWKAWLEIAERLFSIAESADTDLGRRLNSSVDHAGDSAPMKVFVMERIASLVLAGEDRWKSVAYNPFLLPTGESKVASFTFETRMLDSLKHAYLTLGYPEYMEAYNRLRDEVSERVSSA